MQALLARRTRLIFVVLALTAGSLAFAQGEPRTQVVVDEEAMEDPATQVPASRYIEVAQTSVATMRASMTRVLDELREARSKKDAVQLTCVNEQVTAMKGMLRVSEDAMVALQEAMSANDTERARYEFRKIQVSKMRMDELLSRAINCAGAESTESSTSVEMEIDESLAIIDPYYGDSSFFFNPSETLVSGDSGSLGDNDVPDLRPPPASNVI